MADADRLAACTDHDHVHDVQAVGDGRDGAGVLDAAEHEHADGACEVVSSDAAAAHEGVIRPADDRLYHL